MHYKTRPAATRPGSMTNARELGERLRLSRERLAASELATIGRAWRLWAACTDATVGYSRTADRTFATTLGKAAGIDRQASSSLLRRFHELGVFEWHAAPRGSRAISELRLPRLEGRGGHTWSGHHMISDKAHQSGGLGATLQSNTPSVQSSKAIPIEPLTAEGGELEDEDAETGAPTSGSVEEVRALEELPRGELERQAYRAVKAGDAARLEAIRDELHRRDVSHSALAMFGEPAEGSFHGDERTGDGIGDDERSQMLWLAANPTQARARRRAEQRRRDT